MYKFFVLRLSLLFIYISDCYIGNAYAIFDTIGLKVDFLMFFIKMMKERLVNVFYTFPVQLIKMQLKHNLLLLGFWAFLFVVISGGIGSSMGIH